MSDTHIKTLAQVHAFLVGTTRRYIFTATDHASRFAFALAVPRANSSYAQQQSWRHCHAYPRCPKMNAYYERFNRTIQEEFVDY